jgi:hypothetical protein
MGKRYMHVGLGLETWRKEPLGRRRCSWEDNIKIDLEEVGWEDADRIDMIQDRDKWRAVLNTVMNLLVP